MYGMELMTKIFEIVQGIIQTITETAGLGVSSETVLPQEIIDAVSNTGFLESIPLWAVTLLGSIFITILSFVMILTVYGRFFKLYMYTDYITNPTCGSCRGKAHKIRHLRLLKAMQEYV